MDLFRKLWKARKLIVVVFIPLSLLPLPLIHPTSEACCAYVLMVTAVYWVSEAVPLGAAALVPAFLYPLFGVLKSSEVAAEYCKDTTLLLMGVICLAASIEKWNLHKRIALRMVMIAGAKPGMLVLGFMCCTVFLSMWLSNTSTTAMVMPIAEAVLQQLICTGLADSHNDSETTEAPEDDGAVSEKEENLDKNQLEMLYRNDRRYQGPTLEPGLGLGLTGECLVARSARNGDVGSLSSRLTTCRKVHEGAGAMWFGWQSWPGGLRRPNPWTKTLAIGTCHLAGGEGA
ncbi:hypothetical protein L3Q82_000613 [Scortum barcoo]|uniref:Uncharacterized protein n=1 Tax=Scortum barcoo TaxID=214431 RepID=A0ACB8WFE1_9TELE|nr:hypothetical protein L3Q82_000613 [Scortum barcoo]